MKKSTLFVAFLLLTGFLRAQCTAPSFTVDLSAQTDTTWTLSGQSRGGVCCGSSNCVTFTVKTNPGTELISFDVTSPSPSGSAYYQVNCGTPVSIGTPLCIVGLPSPFTITYCKPGGDHPDYVITAGTVVHASDDISIQKTSCVDTLTVTNVTPSSVQWTSIFPGAQGAYNSYLSCTSGCTSTLVTPGPNPPAYVDYMVSGTPNTTCGASFDRDTVRVYFVANLTGTVTPTNPIICASSGTQVTLTANASGGAVPYNYTWSTGPHTQSINVSAAGTYTVTIGDNTKCPKISITKTISTLPSASFSFTGGAYCKNGINPTPTYTNNGQSGTFSANPAGLVFVSTSTGEINLAASNAGTYTVTNFIAASNGCPNVSSTATVTINPFPAMTSASTATICTGSAVIINLTSSVASTYTWIATDNVNTTGESLTTQTTATLNNTLVNASSTNQVVLYTVTPTAISSGGCVGTSQTVSVTVRPKDNAGFTYSSSTFCQTGTFPTASITGLAGGTFSGSAGLVFSNASNGTINLSSTGIGSFTVTYTTNGPCPNASTFPITITLAPSATFSFTGSPYCQNQSNPFPTFAPGASGGTFTSQAGLVFVNSSTGEVNLAASTPGTYTVTNNIPAQAGCAQAIATATITITQLKNGAFSYTGSPYCQNTTNPSPTFAGGAVGGVFSSQAGLSINSGSGLINLAGSTPGTYTVTNTLAAVGGCPPVVNTTVVTITPLPIATFTYTGTPYCNNGSDPVPAFTGGGVAGAFSASSVFVSIDPNTGVVDLSNSVTGPFIITNTIPAANGCPLVSATASITITPLPIASFSFTANPYCQNGSDPTPVLSANGSNGNWTSSPAGLNLNSSAGTVILASSTPGTYTVTNSIAAANGCPAVAASNTVSITALPIGTFTYAATPYCVNQSNPSPTFTGGGVAGSFASQAGLNLNTSTGQINLSASTPGTYTITNSIAAAAGCPVVDEQAVIVINAMDDPSFGYPGSTFCQSGSDPSPAITGLSGGTFSSGSLIIDPGTGVIDLSASPLGTFTVGYTTNGACPNAGNISITITNAPSAAFSYTASPFCTSGTNPVPNFPAGSSAGIYSSTPSGLSLDTITGQVVLGASSANTYTVTNTIAASGGCAVAVATTVLQINQAATANADPDQVICFGTTVNLNGAVGGGASSGSWTGGSGTYSPGPGALGAAYSPTSADSLAGVITLTLTTNDPAGVCPAVADVMDITINQPATANASLDQTVCYGTNITLAGAVGGSASAGTWTGGTGSFAPNDSTLNSTYIPSAADSAAGGITLTLTTNDPSGICPAVNDAMIVTINQPATANANVNQTICFGNAVTLAGSVGGSATGGTWTGGTGIFSPGNTALNATYTPTSADSATGISVLVLTTDDPLGICAAVTDTMVININQPALVNANSDQVICYGTQVILAGTVGGSAGTATWNGGNGTYTPNDSTLTAAYIPTSADSTAGTITLTLITNDPAGVCPAVSDAMTVTINQPATVHANADQTICFGSTVNLNGNIGGSAGSGTWSGGNGGYAPSNTTLNGTYTPVSADSLAGTISMVLTTDDPTGVCPSVTDTMKLTINQPATVSAGTDQTICYGATVTLNGSIGGSATTGTWTGGTGTYLPNANAGNAGYTPTSADSLAGTITLTFTTDDPTGVCPSVNDVMTVTMNQPATVNASADQSICYGSNVALNGSIGGSASNATWNGGNGTYTPSNTTLNGTYVPNAADSVAGTVTLTLTTDDPTGICAAVTDTMMLHIFQPATVNASSDQVLCFGSTVALNGSVGGSATTGTWSGGSGSYTPNNTTMNGTYTPTSADSLAGTITLVLTSNDPASVCQAVTDTMKVTLNQPATANASGDQTVCYGGTVPLNGVIGGSASSGSWSGGNGTFTPNASTLNASYTPSAADSLAGGVTLILTTNDPTGVCNAVTDSMRITVNPLPTIPSLANDSLVYCQSQTVAPITASGNGTILWSTSPTMSPVIHIGPSYSPGTLPSGTTVFYLQDTLATGCKSSSLGTVSVTINTTPATPTLTASSNAYCQNAAVGAITTTGSSTSIWSTTPTMSPVIFVGSSFTPSGLNLGPNTFYVQDSSAQGCKSTSTATITITINPNPSLGLIPSVDSAHCGFADGSITVVPSGGTPGYSYQWYNGSTLITGAFTSTLNNVGPGSYSVNMIDANGCPAVAGTNTFTIGSSTAISSSFTATATQGSVPLDVLFTSSATNVSTYNWSLGNGMTTGGSPFAQATYTTAGTYTVMLTTSYGTCISTSTLTILVEGTPDIVIPNIFSPNGDNINDLFGIITVGVTDLHADIYNRWGTHIHTLSGVNDTWDGKSDSNKTASEGTYYVILTAKTIDGKAIEKQGFVTLVR